MHLFLQTVVYTQNARLDYERNANRFIVTDLPNEIAADDIHKAFIKYAETVKVELPTHRGEVKGFSLVHIPDDSEFKALSESLGKQVSITVKARNETRDFKCRVWDPQGSKLIILSLAWETSSMSVERAMSEYGPVVECFLPIDRASQRSRGFAFVVFASKVSADEVMTRKEHVIDGRRVEVRWAIKEDTPEKVPLISADGGSRCDGYEYCFI